ncbi:hypothetical protein HOLleu_31397 [Holothuria leucospilota]|uniref:Uncharacterized protein n=1 Tax=Holothuria leucospilota TaxID=206669 RepID=A0A9Q1BHA4_HOLLE|nr:hypothetical protein HOLleu_31397 [Holothuria leucospilota]
MPSEIVPNLGVVFDTSLTMMSNISDIQRLQRVQNWAAKIIFGATKYEHASPCLQKLHLLPVKERITFKILVTVFQCLQGTAPRYLSPCFDPYQPPRENRALHIRLNRTNRTFSH